MKSWTRRAALLVAIVVALGTNAACGKSQDVWASPGDLIYAVTWSGSSVLFVRSPTSASEELWVAEKGGKAHKIRDPRLPCEPRGYRVLDRADPGHVIVGVLCVQPLRRSYFVDVDIASGEGRVLAAIDAEMFGGAWLNSTESGYVVHGSEGTDCLSVTPVGPEGVRTFSQPAEVDGVRWRFDSQFPVGSHDCLEFGDVGLVAGGGPGDSKAVFLASGAAAGKTGEERRLAPYALVVLDTPDAQPRQIMHGFVDPRGLSVSPDGLPAAVSGTLNGTRGVWIVNLPNGSACPVAKGRYRAVALSGDGKQLAVVRFAADDEVRVLEIGNVCR